VNLEFGALELAWPWLLAALPLPLLVARLLPPVRRATGPRLRLPFLAAMTLPGRPATAQRKPWVLALATLAWVLLVLAASRPQFVGEPISLPVQGRDLMLAVDISGSMEAEDMVLGNRLIDRLSAVKAVAGDFIERREGDRIGLILFGAQAYVQTPLSMDRTTVHTLLDEAAIGLAGKETAIGDAIGLAVKRLRKQPAEDRVLILLTDGANTTGSIDPLQAAKLAAKAGVRIHTIGIGGQQRGGFFAAPAAELDEPTLKAVAKATGGRYFRARDIQGLAEIYQLLDQLEPVAGGEKSFRPRAELYAWPLAGALGLSALLALGVIVAGVPRVGGAAEPGRTGPAQESGHA